MGDEDYTSDIAEKLITFWMFHRKFDANIRDLSRYVNVSRDTVYRWLNRKALPKSGKARLIEAWLKSRGEM